MLIASLQGRAIMTTKRLGACGPDFPRPEFEVTSPLAPKSPIGFPVDAARSVPLQALELPYATELFTRVLRTPSVIGQPVTVAFLNMRNYVQAIRSELLVTAYCAMTFVFADGIGLQAGRKILRLPAFPRISGTDAIPALLHEIASDGCRVFLLGGTPEVSVQAAAKLPSLYPGINVVGNHDGYFRASRDRELLALVNASRPDLLLVGMGTPTQELWLYRNHFALKVRLAICVGGLFHYWSNDLIRSPRLVTKLGLEWLWILSQQPFKWRVYTLDALRYLLRIFRTALLDPE